MASEGGGAGEQLRTNEAAASFREETYRVATTLTPSVTQKFIKLGCVVIAQFEYQSLASLERHTSFTPASSLN